MTKTKYGNIKCIILAAGAGTRMNTQLPKPLHKIGNKTMLERLIKTVRSSGIKDIGVVAGYNLDLLKQVLKKHNIKAIKQKKLLGSADAVKAARTYLGKPNGSVLVLYADTPLLKEATLKGLINSHRCSSAVCSLLVGNFTNPTGYGRILRDASDDIVEVIEEKDATDVQKGITEINVGAYCFKKKELFNMLKRIKKNSKKGEFYLTDIIKHFTNSGMFVASYNECSESEALGINSRQQLSTAETVIRMRKIEKLMQEGVSFIDPATAYIDDEVKIAKDTIIYPSVVIEGEVTIGKDCRIGPFARIRGKTKIGNGSTIGNFVEVVRSHIGSHTRVKHHTYLGDTYLGSKVNVGAGVITANYDGKNKNKTIIKDKAFIGVGAVLIAPIRIGASAMVGAGSVVTKNKNVPDKSVVVGVPAKIIRRKR